MDAFQKDIVTIVRSALTGTEGKVSDAFDLEKGINLARRHNIVAIFYEGALLCGISASDPLLAALKDTLVKNLVLDTKQRNMIQVLTEAFEQRNISYMPMKGVLLKSLYPKTEMRTMGDADILIRLDQYPQITEVLKELKFEFQFESEHELAWSNPFLLLELHKSVIATHDKDLYKYFGTSWALAEKVPGTNSRYEFKPEDFYVYTFAHFTKHYRTSGIGIKHMLDLWIYNRAYPQMDWKYITDAFNQLNLSEFHRNVTKTLAVWFEEAAPNDVTTLITDVVFSSGQYGTAARGNINRTVRETKQTGALWKSKVKKMFLALFLPYAQMKKMYPVLRKMPVLLPLVWVYRWIEIVFFKRKNMRRYIHNMKTANKTAVDEHQDSLQRVGLDFNFEE